MPKDLTWQDAKNDVQDSDWICYREGNVSFQSITVAMRALGAPILHFRIEVSITIGNISEAIKDVQRVVRLPSCWQSTSPLQAVSLVLQTASALAVAECALGFEHRDLHLGNWLCRPTSQPRLDYSTEKWRWSVPTFNVQAFLIDFTMSRISVGGTAFAMDLSYFSDTGGDQNHPIFMNFNNVYRMMKDELGTDFSSYKPVTNLWWLAHIINNVHSTIRVHDSTSDDMDTIALYALERLRDRVLRYSSTMDFVISEVFGETDTQQTL
ncbi:hypothetical protein AVEN_5662-1 [Araneus ventricosus]|uniref:non-specific serine/threonine protein kinase n=1 Tax=Araneus ventricosus TaxID=182803 RepID=A0A4Y2SW59_ARAVE|nr:hypothetical protein AVEN_5662-1 [Araneus ventricosus]